jgi:AAA family ATPase
LPLPVKANLERFASELDGASGRDIKEKFLKGALHAAMLRDVRVIDDKLLDESLEKIRKQSNRTFPSQLFT